MDTWSAADWRVREGNAAEFTKRWEEMLAYARDNIDGFQWARLVQDPSDSNHYISFGSWRDESARSDWMSRPQMGELMGACKEVCASMAGGPVTEVIAV
jgi:heme-degrading monooxygenase HmoA